MHLNTKKIAFAGVMLALTEVGIALGSVIETNTLFLLAAASFFVGIVIQEFGLKALNEDQVSWLQLVDLEGFKKSKVRADYKVERVPAVYLIDPQGKVLITGPTLEEIYFHLQT